MRSFILILILLSYQSISYSVIVSTEQGKLRGELLTTVTGKSSYFSFKGIPYAAPPIGDLRFQAPQPPKPWEGVRNATKHGSVCVQIDFLTFAFIPGSEDCLFLNVYTPKLRPSSPLAVLLFIHGGSFISGSGNDDLFGPDFFIDQNIIVVTINYRLGPLGFLCLNSEELPGNAAMKDQVAAMRWVRRNIAEFGGDPNKVTISGQSAGGASVTLHLLSPMTKGLFRRAIPLSGTLTLDSLIQLEPKRRAIALGKILGYETRNSTALFEFFKRIPAYRLVNTRPEVLIAEIYLSPSTAKTYYFAPVMAEVDFGQERFLVESPETSIRNGRIHNVDLLLGFESKEALFAVPSFETHLISDFNRYPELLVPMWIWYKRSAITNLKLSDVIKEQYFGTRPISIDTMAEMVDYYSDSFEYEILRFTRDISIVNKKKTYLFRSSGVTERNVYGRAGRRYGIIASTHMDILMYLFQANKYNIPINLKSISYKMIEERTTFIANFVKYGNPTPSKTFGVIWQQYNHTTKSYLDLGKKLVSKVQPGAAMMRFWESVYKRVSVPFYFVQNLYQYQHPNPTSHESSSE